mmetsp:Transcript_72444/g.234124  ORF Transcript_72444/g.234124 Transcript_72444/m.234124 type:complete len:98 (-) Transcript_72444:858-1151(-)
MFLMLIAHLRRMALARAQKDLVLWSGLCARILGATTNGTGVHTAGVATGCDICATRPGARTLCMYGAATPRCPAELVVNPRARPAARSMSCWSRWLS